MAKPQVTLTGFGGPCIICGEYVFDTGRGNDFAEHFWEKHPDDVPSHQRPVKKRAEKVPTTEMFDLDEFKRDAPPWWK